MIMGAMPVAGILPESVGPYVSLMMAGFLIGVLGHLTRSRWLVAVGIILVFLAAAAFPLALNLFSDKPEPPGKLPRPY
jgi:hypothetical protein